MRVILSILLLWVNSLYAAKYPVIIDHDGGVDDVLATAVVASNKAIETKAILITPADSWGPPALDATRSLIRHMGLTGSQVFLSTDQGKNKFPAKWRNDSYRMLSIEYLLPSCALEDDPYFNKAPAVTKLVSLLSTGRKFDLLVTGPLSNLAKALNSSPEISKNIHRVYFMGGAFFVEGNVDLTNKPKFAEWNVFNAPQAVNTVLSHKVKVVFVPLDATNQAPVTHSFIKKLQAQEHYQLSKLAIDLYKVIAQQLENKDYQKQYFFWDLLTATAMLDKHSVKLKPIKVKVITGGSHEGQTIISKKGYSALMAYKIDPKRVEDLLLKSYRYNFSNKLS